VQNYAATKKSFQLPITNFQSVKKFRVSNFEIYDSGLVIDWKLESGDWKFIIKFMKFKNKSNSGFVALTTVLILSAVAIAIGITVSRLAIGEGQASLAMTSGESQLHFVEGCMEDALSKARTNSNYSSGTITRPEGTCNVTVSKAGNAWTITTTQTGADYAKSVQVAATRTVNGITITSWQEN
jgi:hypothetical protein